MLKIRLINQRFPKNVVEMISVQSTEVDHAARLKTSELYEQDVQLISKGGKIYYLPSEGGKLENA